MEVETVPDATPLNARAHMRYYRTGALPRKYDRDTMNEAYAISPEVLARVVTFPPGNWYVVSSGALGINNVPIRITAPNREVELAMYFKNKAYLTSEGTKALQKSG